MSEPPDSAKDDTAECLHCEINELVQDRLQQDGADLGELAAMIIESLAELILLAPESEHSKLMADALAHFGHTFLEKSGAMDGTASRATH